MRIAWVAGAEAEMELAFAAVHRLLAPQLDGIEVVPDPQANALAAAFGVAGSPPTASSSASPAGRNYSAADSLVAPGSP